MPTFIFIHHKELIENERNYFISNGGSLVSNRHNPKPFITPFNRQSIQAVAKIGLRLPTLSQLPLVHSQSQRTDILERKNLAERTADKILANINENLTLLSAKSHVEYINRENAFAKRGGCFFQAHHLPNWANDDPKKFLRLDKVFYRS